MAAQLSLEQILPKSYRSGPTTTLGKSRENGIKVVSLPTSWPMQVITHPGQAREGLFPKLKRPAETYTVVLHFFVSFGHMLQLVGSFFPDQGLNPCPQQWKHRVLTTRPSGKSSAYSALYVALAGNREWRLALR